MSRLILFSVLLLVGGCRQSAPLFPADTMFINGKVLTLDEDSSTASVVVVDEGLIVAVGNKALYGKYGPRDVVDLDGRVLMPGFVDSHTHIRGRARRHVELGKATSIRQIGQLLGAKAAELGPGEWISGYGWSEDALAEQRRPLRADLDAAAPDNPVLLTRAGGHSAVANSLALELAGVDRDTPQPEGGVIEYDGDGEPNGIIRERQAIVGDLIPEASDDELRESLVAALRDQLRLGITSLVQAMDTVDHYAEWERIYQEHRGQLPRAAVQVAWEGAERMVAFGRTSGAGDTHLRLGAIKIFVDGGFTGPAAFTTAPYRGRPDYRGKLNMSVEVLRQTIREAHAAGWQLGIHAIGDAAIELTVEELDAAIADMPRDDHRHYLNHFTIMPSAATMDTMAARGIAITQQPNFTYTLEGRYAEYLDGERLRRNNPLRTPMDHGIHLAISSDILPIGPMRGIHAAVTRRGMSGAVIGEEEALTLIEALRAYTLRGAYLTFEEQQKGSIEPGKFADLIVLDRDITDVDPLDIADIRVEQTWLAGQRVF